MAPGQKLLDEFLGLKRKGAKRRGEEEAAGSNGGGGARRLDTHRG